MVLVLGDVPASVWDDFHAGRSASIAAELAACWSRSRTLGAPRNGAPPEEHLLQGEALRLHREHVELLQAVGDTILDRATARLADRDYLLLLADPDGVVVRTSGGGAFADTASRVRLIAGACWSEAARGTNAIGTAVAANRPTEVHGHAHFGRSYHELVCYAAPVRGPDGLPVAVLDATSRIESTDPEVGRTIVRAARSLESLLRLQAYASAGLSVTRVLGRSLDRMHDAALWIEAPGTVARANAAARRVLGAQVVGADPAVALGLDWAGLMAEALAPALGGRLIELGRGADRRAFRLRVEPVAAPNGMIVAVLAILEPGRGGVDSAAGSGPIPLPVGAAGAPAAARRGDVADAFGALYAEDRAMRAAIDWSRRLAVSDVPVMLLAETGTGKELIAQAVHAASPRAAGPFHAVSCGAVAPGVLEAELFGYAPGAFTGALSGGRTGLFHAAASGTLFLDEVAEMSPAMQAALLRVLETGTFRRVGEVRLERSDARIVCATCRDLPALVASGAFREDLFYRLKGAVVRLPPLRERTDLIGLATHLLGDVALSPAAAAAIAHHAWPGNIRELKSMLAVARIVAAGASCIELDHLPAELTVAAPAAPCSAIDDAERQAVVRALVEAGGNVSRAARALGVARSTLHRMKRRHGVA
ncbi:MAG TPA: sigma 54-interacting transcriptional regulator [Kofleriaceae bacterium]